MTEIEQIKFLFNNNNRGWGQILYRHYLKNADVAHLLLVKGQIFEETGIVISTFNLANKRAYYKKKELEKSKTLKAKEETLKPIFSPEEIQKQATQITKDDILKGSIKLPEGI